MYDTRVEWGWVVEWTYLFFSLEVLGCEWEVCGCARNSTIGTGDKQCQLDFMQLHAVWGWGYMVGFRCYVSARAASDGLTTVLTCVVVLHCGMCEGARDGGRDLKGEGGTARVGE